MKRGFSSGLKLNELGGSRGGDGTVNRYYRAAGEGARARVLIELKGRQLTM